MRPQPVRVAIDLETTGLRSDQDAIIEIGAVKFAGERVIDTFQSFVAPSAQLPYRIQRLTGITPALLHSAPTLAALIPRVRAFLGDAPLVGHSVQFDAAFLRRAGLARQNPLLDTYELATMLLPGLRSYTLATVGAALAIPASTYHRALADAQLAREVFLILSARLADLDPSTLQSLNQLASDPDWTPRLLIRTLGQTQNDDQRRNDNASPFGAALKASLGQQLQAQLGVDPGVLSMAVALDGESSPPAPMRHRAAAPAPTRAIAEPLAAHDATEERSENAATESTATMNATAMTEAPEATMTTTPTHETSSTAQTLATPHVADLAPGIFVEAIAPAAIQAEVAARRRAASAGIAACLTAGGATFVEVERNDESALACLIPVVKWVVATGGRTLIAAADGEQMARVARTLLPEALARVGAPDADAFVVELDEYEAYLCLHRWFGVARDARGATLSQDVTRGLAKLIVWSKATHTGVRSELTLAGHESLAWERVRAGGDLLDTSAACAYQRGGYCFTTRARSAAANASLLVTTQAALAAHLAGRASLLSDLPDATRVVILDAHLLEEELQRAGSLTLERRAVLDLLATLGAYDERLDDVGGRAAVEGVYTGLFPLAASLLAPTRGSKAAMERGAQATVRWRPAGRERGWFATLTHARGASEALFQALRATMLEAQNEAARGQSGKAGQRDQGRGQGARNEAPEQRTLQIDGRARQLVAWDRALTAWGALDAALAAVATLAREVAQLVQATQGTPTGAGGARRGKGSEPPTVPTIAAGTAYGLVADLLAVARRLDQTRAQGTILFAPSARDDERVRWLRLPYAETFGAPGDSHAGRSNGRMKSPPAPGAARPGGQATSVPAPKAPFTAPHADGATVPARADAAPVARVTSTEGGDARAEEPAEPAAAGSPAPGTPPDTTSASALQGASAASQAAPGNQRAASVGVEIAVEVEPPTLHAAPMRVGALLRPLVAPGHALALTGWSLSVGGDFEYLRGALGLPESVGGLAYTPDYAHQTLMCLPTDAPEPNVQHFQQRLDDAIVALATELGGDLVALFPSHASLRAGAQGVKRALERRDILALAQGIDGSARQLWQTFQSQPRTVLLGAGAFWDGADQREKPPACVFITRVPFPPSSDPLVAARAEGWSDPQSQFVTPQAALKLRQALGGLAWSHQRRNAVVLYDHRLQTRSYGPTILNALPRCTQAQEPMARLVERVADWTRG